MATALISFTIQPGAGSEAGVGWAFLRAAIERSDEPVHLLLDQRDEAAVSRGVVEAGWAGRVTLHPVAVPAPVLRHYGDSRSRQSYIAWVPGARSALDRLMRRHAPTAVHQVTFASAVLPPVLTGEGAGRSVWGPLAVPATAGGGRAGIAAVRTARAVARRNVRRADLVVANNHHTAAFIRAQGREATVEPNIVAEPRSVAVGPMHADALVMAGHLIPRKRPWLAIRAMQDPRLRDLRLEVLGDGPLLGPMRALVDELGLGERVHLCGAVPRGEALDTMSSSRLLVHPSAREGSPWVVGEAAAVGLAAVVIAGSGAEATVELSANGGVVAPVEAEGREVEALADGVVTALRSPRPAPSSRWSASRLPGLLDSWYAPH